MKPEEAFGTVIKKLRVKQGISQEKIAFAGELDRTFVSLLERGKRQPSLTTFLRLATALNIRPELLMKLVVTEMDNRLRELDAQK